MINSGASIKVVQYLMGHSSATITLDRYTHIDYETMKDQIKNIYKFSGVFTTPITTPIKHYNIKIYIRFCIFILYITDNLCKSVA